MRNAARTLNPQVVSAILEDAGIVHKHGPEGFELPDNWALRSGAGAAGRQFYWFLWHLPTNNTRGLGDDGRSVGTPAELKALIRQWYGKGGHVPESPTESAEHRDEVARRVAAGKVQPGARPKG